MDEHRHSKEFYWTNVFFQVEDTLFSVPRGEFEQLSERVFADMFPLPSGPSASIRGQVKEHPIILEGYKKDEFACLLKVMYPTGRSLISGSKIDLVLTKEEWVSVLKLSTIWNMNKIREYAIHRLTTDTVLSPIDKIKLARAHKFGRWLEEGVTSLVDDDQGLTRKELGMLGWETAALILWIKDRLNLSQRNPSTLSFRKDSIRCGFCTSSASLFSGSHNCYHCHRVLQGDEEFKCANITPSSGTANTLVPIQSIKCNECGREPFYWNHFCSSCFTYFKSYGHHNVRISPLSSKEMIKAVFGEEINELSMSVG